MHILRYKFRCLKKYTPPAKWGATEACGIIIRVLCQNYPGFRKEIRDFSNFLSNFENLVVRIIQQ